MHDDVCMVVWWWRGVVCMVWCVVWWCGGVRRGGWCGLLAWPHQGLAELRPPPCSCGQQQQQVAGRVMQAGSVMQEV